VARGVDWNEARDFWLALDPPRSYETVARQFGVSGTRVRFVAKRDNWAEPAARIDAEALARVQRRIVLSREQRVAKTLSIVDGALAHFDENLEERVREAKLADVPGLVKLAELLIGEATDRMSFAEVQEALGVVIDLAVEFLPAESKLAFIAAVRERLGGAGSEAA
jgi:hypothetical protein